MRDTTTNRVRRASLALLLMLAPAAARAQAVDSAVVLSPNYWQKFTLGVATSILMHEAAHISMAYALGAHPTFGFDKMRPTVFSGINSRMDPRKQFFFSLAGLATQSLIDEAILDIPHRRGGAFERGVLGGGIGTTVFYLTIGRRGSVSDIDFMARMRVMNKTQLTVMFGAIAATHTWRVWRDPAYGNFFARPGGDGSLLVGWSK